MINVYGNGSAGNHGCEALTRSLYKIISSTSDLTFYSLNPSEDKSYGLDKFTKIVPLIKNSRDNGLSYFLYRIKQHFRYSDLRYYNWLYTNFFKDIKAGCLYLSSGGDNYSYGNNIWLESLNKGINDHGGITALVGCSILENISDKNLIKDLSAYHTIIARESITYNALIEAGVKSQIHLCPDPAFQLDPVFLPLPKGFEDGNTVGINVSPMVIEREMNNGILLENYIELIRNIINRTNMQIALIPHVVWSHTDDRKPLIQLYNYFKDTGRVIMIADHNAQELKGFISRCRFMIAARTHASIAAYSESVPTLVVGYSVKSKGIAKDIFGEHKGYVVPIDAITKSNDLTFAFNELQNREESIKSIYKQIMTEYKNNTLNILNYISSI